MSWLADPPTADTTLSTTDPHQRRLLTRTLGSPLKLALLADLIAQQPCGRSRSVLERRLGTTQTALTCALLDLVGQGIVVETARSNELWYTLAASPVARALTRQVATVRRRHQTHADDGRGYN